MKQAYSPDGNGVPPAADPCRALADLAPAEPFARLARLAGAALRAPAALLAVVADRRERWPGAFGLPEALTAPGERQPPSPFLQQLVSTGKPLAVENAAAEARFARDPLVTQAGMVALLGVPLGPPTDHLPVGLVVMDSRPRAWTPEEIGLLRDLGESALTELEVLRLRGELSARAGGAGPEDARQRAALVAGVPVGLFVLDPEGRMAVLNPEAARFFQRVSGRGPEELVGKSLWQECPEVADSTFAKECQRVEAEHRPFQLETYFPGLRRWFAFHGTRSPEGLCIAVLDVTERVALEKSLRARAEELAALVRGKEQFLEELAHELRNCLVPIRNALHLWGARDTGHEGDQARGMADREVRRPRPEVEDLLKVVQLTPGRYQGEFEPLDLAAVAAEALRAALASPEARGQKLEVDLPPEPVPVAGDREMLELALVHLLSNAAKFTRPGGRVGLEVRRDGDEAVLRVTDTGVGIEPEALPGIFDLFMRGDHFRGRLRDGLGVGLTLVRRIVRLHGGEVEAHSEGPDRGSEFVVRLPLRAEPAPAPAAPGGAQAPGPKPPSILVVDNSKEAAQSLALLVREWGYEVRLTYDPFSALEEARARPPAVVLLDIGMPGMDGYEAARRLRSQPESKDAVLVAVTGYGEEADRQRAREAGFDYHMTKPVDPEDLQALLVVAAFREGAGPATS
jgi:signal transduction histidine kinase/ActR/RegA family two-component response regulator